MANGEYDRLFKTGRQQCVAAEGADASAAPKPGFRRWVFISDTHGRHSACFGQERPLPAGDVLVHCGDTTNTGEIGQLRSFAAWFGAQAHPHKIVIAGNHDLSLDRAFYDAGGGQRFHGKRRHEPDEAAEIMRSGNFVYLEDEGCEVLGRRVWGSPWTPTFCDWAFNQPRGGASAARWATIPTNTDVLLTHGPPLGHGDLCSSGDRAGCTDLLREVTGRIKPAVHAFGHVHEGAGVTTDGTGTLFVNASSLDGRYRPANAPIVVDLQ